MLKQEIKGYSGCSAYDIQDKIAKDAERLNMKVFSISLTSCMVGYSVMYDALVVFEEVKE